MISKKKDLVSKRSVVLMCVLMLLFLFIILTPNFVSALPSLPTEFYGVIRDYNANASAGELVRAYDSGGTLCGSFTIVNDGFYGSLTCAGDDPETSTDEGATAGENISFRYKGGFTTVMGNNTWGYGVFQYVNLTYPVVYCGDWFCDSWYEDYYSCPEDCPLWNGSINISINISEGGEGGDGGGEGGGGAESRGALGMMPNFYLNYTGLDITGVEDLGFICQESWVCGNWSECRIDEFQNRTCIDRNDCGTFENKPPEIQKCVYTPTCFDSVKNGLEEGVDCGGLCPPCITCYDGIQNCHDGLCEEGTDCGGPCPSCPTCYDGKQNCHDGLCENGIDCGGPCEKKCPGIQIAIPGLVCKKDFNPLSNQSIFFFILILLLILGDIVYSKKKIDDIKEKKKLSDIKRARAILSIRRRMYLFIFITILISIILYLYYYFFIMCEVEYRFLWLLLLLLFISPIIIHKIMKYIEYTEKKRLNKLRALLDTHYKQIENLVRIENENLIELEQEIADELYRLLENPEYKEKEEEVSEEIKVLKDVYKELVFLYSKYKERQNPIDKERILCDDVYKLIEEERYRYLIQNDPRLKSIVTKLKLLYKQYEEKQKLYDEMDKIEESKYELEHELKRGKRGANQETEEEKEESKEDEEEKEKNRRNKKINEKNIQI
ncbi:hypothetical protein KY348_03570 [Candidatus Woesearchaeota archaeon]|nr:hypothetical protein [Candidatus Woesearchaeota archaeon]